MTGNILYTTLLLLITTVSFSGVGAVLWALDTQAGFSVWEAFLQSLS